MAKNFKDIDNATKLRLYAQGLPDDAITEWLDFYEKAVAKGKDPEAASDHAWSMLNKKWEKADNGKWVKINPYTHSNWANELTTHPAPVIEVFRAGEYPQGTITIEDLDVMVNAYDPAIFEAPVTIDHVKAGPAYGWVSTIFRQGDRLWAVLKNLTDDFKQKIKDGKYKNRSIEIFELEFKGERIWPYFGAVTFLGANWPQVKGMAEPVFLSMADGCISAGCYSMDIKDIIGFPVKETDTSIRITQIDPGNFRADTIRTIELAESEGIEAVVGKRGELQTVDIQSLIFDRSTWTVEKAKTWIGENRGKIDMEDLNSLYDNGGIFTMEIKITQEQLDAKLEAASTKAAEKAVAEFKAGLNLDDQKAEIEKQKAENDRLKKNLLDKETVNAQQFALSQFDHLSSQGKLLPAEKEMWMSIMTILSPDKAEIKFSSDFTGTPAKAFVAFFEAMKPRVDLKHRTAGDPNDTTKKIPKKKKGDIAEGANALTLKRQEYMDENLPEAMKAAGDPKEGSSEWQMTFSAVYANAVEETAEQE